MNKTRTLIIAFVCVTLIVVLAILFLPKSAWSIFNKQTVSTAGIQDTPLSPEALLKSWHTQVDGALAIYDQDHDAARAKAFLLAAKVPSEDRDIHLHLVLAFDLIIQTDSKGEAALTKARADYQAAK